MSGARSMAANNILLLRKAEGKRQRDALRKAFKVITSELCEIHIILSIYHRRLILTRTRDCHLMNTFLLSRMLELGRDIYFALNNV